MWILFGLLVAWVLFFVGGGPIGWMVIGSGLLLGTLWQILQELVRLRHAYEEQTRILRRALPPYEPTRSEEEEGF